MLLLLLRRFAFAFLFVDSAELFFVDLAEEALSFEEIWRNCGGAIGFVSQCGGNTIYHKARYVERLDLHGRRIIQIKMYNVCVAAAMDSRQFAW